MRLVLFSFLLATACERTPPPQGVQPTAQEKLMEENKLNVQREQRDIDSYIRRHELIMRTTGTGVRYVLVRDIPGDTARPDQFAHVNYRMELLDGTLAYASEPGAPEVFLVEMDDVESGLHEAIQHLSPGDSALFIIPSYRAFGLIGDMEKIPMRSTLVYHIGLHHLSERRQ